MFIPNDLAPKILSEYLFNQIVKENTISLTHIYLEKGNMILKEGDICKYIYFIVGGTLEVYTCDTLLTKTTKAILTENSWCSDFMSFGSGFPSHENIRSSENSELFAIEKNSLKIAMDTNPLFQDYYIQILEGYYKNVGYS